MATPDIFFEFVCVLNAVHQLFEALLDQVVRVFSRMDPALFNVVIRFGKWGLRFRFLEYAQRQQKVDRLSGDRVTRVVFQRNGCHDLLFAKITKISTNTSSVSLLLAVAHSKYRTIFSEFDYLCPRQRFRVEVVSEPECKACEDSRAERTQMYVSIGTRSITQQSGLETASRIKRECRAIRQQFPLL